MLMKRRAAAALHSQDKQQSCGKQICNHKFLELRVVTKKKGQAVSYSRIEGLLDTVKNITLVTTEEAEKNTKGQAVSYSRIEGLLNKL